MGMARRATAARQKFETIEGEFEMKGRAKQEGDRARPQPLQASSSRIARVDQSRVDQSVAGAVMPAGQRSWRRPAIRALGTLLDAQGGMLSYNETGPGFGPNGVS